MESRLLLTPFVVTSTADSGLGTLRQAILDVDAGLFDTIDFSIGSGGVQTIAPSTALPAITSPVIIDGTSQPGFDPSNPTPMIQLTGSNITVPNVNGLTISTGNSTVKGMVINSFTGSGILLFGSNATGNLVQGNYIGTDISGTTAVANVFDGVDIIDASNNTIGGTIDAARNVISGNGIEGIYISTLQGTATSNVVEGNYIGTDVTGAKRLANIADGVAIVDASNNTIGGTTAGAATSSRAMGVMASTSPRSRAARRVTWSRATISASTPPG